VKLDRLPSNEKVEQAKPHLVNAYKNYGYREELSNALREDVSYRFLDIDIKSAQFPYLVTDAVYTFVKQIGQSRNFPRF
jgi:hypothetical protein